MSPALQSFLQQETEAPEPSSALEEALTGGTLAPLGDLDITTGDSGLQGLEAALERFADHDVLRAVLDLGSDPREYGRQYEAQLRSAELESIQDYIAESDNLVALHGQISSCDTILASMEDMLGKFQGDLGNISTEIRALQEQSQSMSVKLKNRRAAEGRLGGFIEALALPPALVEGIMQSDVNETFQENLLLLHKKLDYAEKDDVALTSAALRDVAPELDALRSKAVAKARDFLMARIYALRKPKTNIQILQQNVLLRGKYLVTFLRLHGREVFTEIRAAYVDTLSRVLSSHFRAYLAAIERLQVPAAGPGDVVGSAEVATGGMMAMFAKGLAAAAVRDRSDAFQLGERAAVLSHLDQAAIIPHVATAEGHKFPYEVLFRSLNKLLMDTATSEYLFCLDFFQDQGVFSELFAATLSVVEGSLNTQLLEMSDLICLLLMIRINYHHQLIMTKRRIPCLDDYFDRVTLMVWPRLKAAFDLQLSSIKQCGNTSIHDSVQVHPITQRYAQLTSAMLILNADYQDGQLDGSMERMRYAAMDLMIRMSRSASRKRIGTVFLITNFDHVLTGLREAGVKASQLTGATQSSSGTATGSNLGQMGTDTMKEFEDQLSTCTNIYVEEVLSEHFSGLLTFTKRAEAANKARGDRADAPPAPGFGAAEAGPVVRDFTARWASALEQLHRDTLREFKASQTCGREVLKAAMTQLLLYYTRLLDLLKRCGPEGASLFRDAVTVPSIMYEIKRYNRS
ncbi:hypothetical protein WJX74_005159 [Apatococcus lobatus]